jgi:hypothetical protein
MRAQKGHLGGQISPQSPLQKFPQEHFWGKALFFNVKIDIWSLSL